MTRVSSQRLGMEAPASEEKLLFSEKVRQTFPIYYVKVIMVTPRGDLVDFQI